MVCEIGAFQWPLIHLAAEQVLSSVVFAQLAMEHPHILLLGLY